MSNINNIDTKKEKKYKVSVNETNMKRIAIIQALLIDEIELLSKREVIDYIVNKAIEFYFKSDEIQSKIKNL